MRSSLSIFIFCFSFITLLSNHPSQNIGTADLCQLAAEYGHKAANLIILDKQAKQWSNELDATIAVPPFICLSSSQVQSFIKKHLAIDIVAEWKNISLKKDLSKSNVLQRKIVDGFNKLSHNKNVSHIVMTLLAQARSYTESFFSYKGPYMIRSSGAEDRKNLANAGGNTTIANVSSAPHSLCQAIGEVIGSYFSTFSLQQRSASNDTITETPLTPVIIQRMIGERDNVIPQSGVMFTEEPGGHHSRAHTTTGITIIQAAWGHNELVVDNRGSVDTFIIDTKLRQYSTIRKKNMRLIPGDGGTLHQEQNSPSLTSQETLTPAEVILLKKVANCIEKLYGGPMDVEFVLMAGILYLVQARPIVHKEQGQPRYTDMTNEYGIKLKGKPIVSANSRAEIISDEKQVLIYNTIEQALAAYIRLSHSEQANIICVCTRDNALATSHAAVAFQGFGKPVFCFGQAITKLTRSLSTYLNPKHTIVFDPQLSFILFKKNKEVSFIDGWASYPLPCELSLPTVRSALEVKKRHASLQKTLPSMKVDLRKQSAESFLQLMSTLKTASQKEARQTLADIFHFIHKIPRQNDLAFFAMADRIIEHVSKVLHIPPSSPDYLATRLFALHFLQALLFQDKSAIKDGRSLFQLLRVQLIYQRSQKILSKILSTDNLPPDHIKLLAHLEKVFIHPNLRRNWLNFIVTLGKNDPIEIKRFGDNISLLARLGLIPLWCNTSFFETQSLKELNKECEASHALLNRLHTQSKKLEQLDQARFSSPQTFPGAWKDFEESKLSWFTSKEFHRTFTHAPRLGKLATLSAMEKFINYFDSSIKTVTGSNEFQVTVLPSSFSKVRKSKKLTHQQITQSKDKIFTMHLMLEEYLRLLQSWYTLLTNNGVTVPDYVREIYQGKKKEFPRISVDKVIHTFAPGFLEAYSTHTHSQDQLFMRSAFNVNNVVIGSESDILYSIYGKESNGKKILKKEMDKKYTSSYLPIRYEEFFTFCHQSLLALIGMALSVYGPAVSHLPAPLQVIDRALQTLTTHERIGTPVRLVSQELTPSELILSYNYPQRQHSAKIRVTYLHRTRKTKIDVTITGANEGDRWHYVTSIANWVNSVPEFTHCDIFSYVIGNSDYYSDGKAVFISFAPTEIKKSLPQIIKLIKELSDLTMMVPSHYPLIKKAIEVAKPSDTKKTIFDIVSRLSNTKLIEEDSWIDALPTVLSAPPEHIPYQFLTLLKNKIKKDSRTPADEASLLHQVQQILLSHTSQKNNALLSIRDASVARYFLTYIAESKEDAQKFFPLLAKTIKRVFNIFKKSGYWLFMNPADRLSVEYNVKKMKKTIEDYKVFSKIVRDIGKGRNTPYRDIWKKAFTPTIPFFKVLKSRGNDQTTHDVSKSNTQQRKTAHSSQAAPAA